MRGERVIERLERLGRLALYALAPGIALGLGACGERVQLGSDLVATPPPNCPPAPCGTPCPPPPAPCLPEPPCTIPPAPPCTNPNGCVPPPPVCPEPACLGKGCGESCWVCPPTEPNCPPPPVPPPPGGPPATICDLVGRCVAAEPAMVCPASPEPPPPFPPVNLSCAAAPCGAICALCGANEPGCAPAGEMGQCDLDQVCVVAPVACP
jgi:hypothetical protein